jgi:riboflavin synthase alpha subunit
LNRIILVQVGISPETLRLTNLGALKPDSAVNLERAASMEGRNSGHMVQGHIDNVGEIVQTWPDKESLFFKVTRARPIRHFLLSNKQTQSNSAKADGYVRH